MGDTASSCQLSGSEPFQAHLGQLFFLTSIFFLSFLGRIALAPLLPAMEADLGLDHAQAGGLFFMLALGYFPSLLGSGFLSSRLDHRGAIIISALSTGAALLLVAWADTLWGLRLGLFLTGFGAGFYLPSGLAALTALVKPDHWGKALSVHEIAPNLSFVLAPLLGDFMLRWWSWRSVPLALGLASLGLGLAFMAWGKSGRHPGQAPDLGSLSALGRLPGFWALMALFGLGISSTMGIYTMLPLFLVNEKGMELGAANLLVASSRLAGVGAAFVAGWATDRLGPLTAIRAVMLTTGVLTILLGWASGWWLAALLFLQPLVAVCFFPAGFAALSRVGTSRLRGVAVSLTVPAAYVLGGGALPAGIGYLGQTMSFAWAFSLAGACMVGAWLLTPLLKLRSLEQADDC